MEMDLPALQLLVKSWAEVASYVFLFYDYSLTLDIEVERFWKRSPFSLNAALFYLIRYVTLLNGIAMLSLLMGHDPVVQSHGCRAFSVYQVSMIGISQTILGCWQILRTYVLYDRSRTISILLWVVAGCASFNGMFQSMWVTYLSDEKAGPECRQGFTEEEGLHMACMWIGIIIFDALVFGLTLAKTMHIKRGFRSGKAPRLWHLIQSDGQLYFGSLTLVNFGAMLCFILAPADMKNVAAFFSANLSSVLICRMILNLRGPTVSEGHIVSM